MIGIIHSKYFLMFSVLLFPIAHFCANIYDEVLTLLMIFFFLGAKNKRLELKERYIIIVLLVLYSLGFISNYRSKLIFGFPVVIDAFVIFKPILLFICARHVFNAFDRQKLVSMLKLISKLYLLLNFFLGIASQFVDLGMTDDVRYGINAYFFLFNGNMYGTTILCSILILSFSSISNKYFLLYLLIACIDIILTTKGTYIIFVVMAIFQLLIVRKGKIKGHHVLLVIPIILYFSSFQLESYLKNPDSVRMLFIYYGYVTASKYFPFGSGFATFGSSEAANNYSPLYYEYGFDHLYGLNPDEPLFLNDVYLGSILGELGFIAFFLFLFLLYLLYKTIIQYSTGNRSSQITISSCLFVFMICTIATGIFKGESGALFFYILGILLTSNDDILKAKKDNLKWKN